MKTIEVKALLEKLEIKPLKSLGQNFLVNSEMINKICSYNNLESFEQLIEIGPGLGSLTRVISQEQKDKLTLIELDRSLAAYWEEEGFKVFPGDALKFEWDEVEGRTLLISNLPYQISSRILVELFLRGHQIENMILMFQREVGERIRADVEDKKIYGLLSIICQLEWKIKKVTNVPRTCFYPAPDVESVVLSFERRKELPQNFKRREFVNFLKQLFSSRRKKIKGTLKNQLKSGLKLEDESVLDKRPDHLSPNDHFNLFQEVFNG